jgi:ABC-type dipeptide/oligopeptide/nickel transport system ATPase component
MIFQEPMTALNPVMRARPDRRGADGAIWLRPARRRAGAGLMRRVGIPDPGAPRRVVPHELGRMRQRVMIAIALSHEPG